MKLVARLESADARWRKVAARMAPPRLRRVTRWQVTYQGRRVEVEPTRFWEPDEIRLSVAGKRVAVAGVAWGERTNGVHQLVARAEAAEAAGATDTGKGAAVPEELDSSASAEAAAEDPDAPASRGVVVEVSGGGVTVKAVLAWHGAAIEGAEVVVDGGPSVELEPEPGSAAAKLRRLEREHPNLYDARHAAKGIARGLAPLLVPLVAVLVVVPLVWLLSLLPSLPLPAVDLPNLPWPAIDLPDLPWPDITVPGWAKTLFETARYWLPALAGIAIAVSEGRKRRRRRARDEAARADELARPDHE